MRLKFTVVALILSLVLAACGGSAEPTPTSVPPTDTPAPATATPEPPTPTPEPATATAEPTSAEETQTSEAEQPETMAVAAPGADDVYGKSPWWPWLSAHIDNEQPPAILGGPITLHGVQEPGGGANFVLPGSRRLDPTVFGTADSPQSTEVPPIILGVPAETRTDAPNGDQMTSGPTPFSDQVATVPGQVEMTLVDATAMDGATTADQVDFEATFQSPNGQDTYRVVVEKAAPHGWFIPTGGGVVTNFIQHGVTKWGTQLMPTEYSYVSFWGLGDVYKNDELIAEGRLVHGMQTEFVRKPPYDLAFDNEVNPKSTHFHLIVPPFTPKGEQSPLPTGFELPNGQEMPFFHVMFPAVQWTSQVGDAATERVDLPYTSIPASPEMQEKAQAEDAPYRQSPWWPWLSAHVQNENPPQLLTGPIEFTLSQAEDGAANFMLPGPRRLDPTVFGTADDPKATEVPPIVLGVPAEMRTGAPDGGQTTSGPTPFGNQVATVQGSLQATLVDATAMDGARTQDSVDFTATFGSPNGQDTYRVEVKNAVPHGWFIPTGGGVVSNFIQHGLTKWGTQLMPTEYSYVSFWGMGNIYRNDELIAEGRVVHGMLTEFVRKQPYDLGFDSDVNPNATHFHLMIPPFDPFGNPSPVPTGFELPNGQEQPFFHVMFPVTQAQARPLGAKSAETMAAEATTAAQPTETPTQVVPPSAEAREIQVTARVAEFSPNEFTIKKGKTVRFVVTAEDVFHTFTVKEDKAAQDFIANLNLFPGQAPASWEWTPAETGDYYLFCIPHEGLGMTGTIHVVDE